MTELITIDIALENSAYIMRYAQWYNNAELERDMAWQRYALLKDRYNFNLKGKQDDK